MKVKGLFRMRKISTINYKFGKYEGEIKLGKRNGKFDGKGTLNYLNGKEIKGIFKEGKFVK